MRVSSRLRPVTIAVSLALAVLVLPATIAAGQTAAPATAKPTADEQARADELVRRVNAVVDRYKNVNNALADGYFNMTPGSTGTNHYLNIKNFKDETVMDPAHPENLMYNITPDGKSKLAGIMFVMRGPGEAGPKVGGPLTKWHLHEDECWSPLGLPASALLGNSCPTGYYLDRSPEMIHVWIIPNASGPFGEDMEAKLSPGDFADAQREMDPQLG